MSKDDQPVMTVAQATGVLRAASRANPELAADAEKAMRLIGELLTLGTLAAQGYEGVARRLTRLSDDPQAERDIDNATLLRSKLDRLSPFYVPDDVDAGFS